MMFFRGNGRFDFDIVGESYRQDVFGALAGEKLVDGCDIDCLAVLAFQDDNPHDSNAVACAIVMAGMGNNPLVGFLSRKNAKLFRKEVIALGGPDPLAMLCRAKIVGGWDDGFGDTGQYGLKLDLRWPLELRTNQAKMIETINSLVLPWPT